MLGKDFKARALLRFLFLPAGIFGNREMIVFSRELNQLLELGRQGLFRDVTLLDNRVKAWSRKIKSRSGASLITDS
jgi:hypothetical protein